MRSDKSKASLPAWKNLVAKYQKSSTKKSIWQFTNSFIPFIITWYLMYLCIDISYWLSLSLAFVATGFFMRLFIIQHDCGHGSFFKSKRANNYWGMFISIFTFTPYHYWKKSHAIHHASVGNLEHRGIGDVYTLTVDEFMKRSKWGKFKYRLYRNPFILFILVPTFLFLVLYRFPNSRAESMKQYHNSVYLTSLAMAVVIGLLIWLIGFKAYLMVQLPISFLSSSLGMWIFYVQHQYEDTYWDKGKEWDYTAAAIQGSSYYKLPKVLQWFTGNIGFHHIHHLSPGIPNYMLEKCHKENPELQNVSVLTLKKSFKSIFLSLWDEKQKKLISFYQFKKLAAHMNTGF